MLLVIRPRPVDSSAFLRGAGIRTPKNNITCAHWCSAGSLKVPTRDQFSFRRLGDSNVEKLISGVGALYYISEMQKSIVCSFYPDEAKIVPVPETRIISGQVPLAMMRSDQGRSFSEIRTCRYRLSSRRDRGDMNSKHYSCH